MVWLFRRCSPICPLVTILNVRLRPNPRRVFCPNRGEYSAMLFAVISLESWCHDEAFMGSINHPLRPFPGKLKRVLAALAGSNYRLGVFSRDSFAIRVGDGRSGTVAVFRVGVGTCLHCQEKKQSCGLTLGPLETHLKMIHVRREAAPPDGGGE